MLPSFDFAHPVYLPLLLLVPPLIWSWSRRRKPALRFPAVGEMAVLPRGRARMAQFGGALLRGLALLMLVIALAGPRTPDSRTRIDTEGIAIFFVADVSGSMAERDFSWNGEPISRLEAAKRVFRRFVSGDTISGEGESRFSGRPTDLIGLVTFATRPETVCPLTLNHSTLLKLLDAEQPRSIPGEAETNISDALAVGLARLDIAGTRRKVLVLLTDGEHNVASPQSDWKPRQAASLAASLGIPIYTIDTGGDTSPNMEPRSSDAPGQSSTERRDHAVAALRGIAHVTGGRYFSAGDTGLLLTAYKEIDTMEREVIPSFLYRRYHSGASWFGLAAFLLLAMALAFEMTFWRCLP